MVRVFSFLKPYKVTVGIALSLMLVELAVELLHPLLMAQIIDNGIMERDLSSVIYWGVIMIAISIFAFISGIVNSYFASHVSQSFGYDVRTALFEKIQSFSFTNFNLFPTSSLITRLTNDITQTQNTVFMGLRIMLRAPLLIIGGVIMALFVNFQLAIIFLIVTPILVAFLVWVMNKGNALFSFVQTKLDQVNSVMRENLTGMRLIKAFLRKKHEVKRFTHANQNLMDKTVSVLRLMEITMPVLLLIMNFSILGILWFGNFQVAAGSATVGEVVAIVNYTTRITGAFSIFSFIIIAFSRAKASATRITEVLDTDIDLVDADEINPQSKVTRGEVEFKDVSFIYPGTNTPVLNDISFKVNRGQTIAILGATGSGKSSLFHLIPRLYDVSGGAVSIDGIDIRSIKLEDLRRQIGFVPQEALLFTGTVAENISWGKENATMEDIVAAAKDAQIHETIQKLPHKYDTKIGQKGVNLSGGQKQRLSIARALVRKPKLLMLDDSTSALDLKTEAKLLRALIKYTCTTFIVTQKISTAMEADHILLLEDGELLAEGTHESLLDTNTLYQKIYDSQFGEGAHHVERAQ
jgi:ATP-binding cassette, subfamily B, multidrug efflux pump